MKEYVGKGLPTFSFISVYVGFRHILLYLLMSACGLGCLDRKGETEKDRKDTRHRS